MLIGLALLCCNSLAHADEAAPLERGTAILEPFALRALDKGPFGLGRMLATGSDATLTSATLFALPAMQPI
ncbi:MAG: hypothetical protein ACK5BX_26615, partial [Bradyrhizobium sp.]